MSNETEVLFRINDSLTQLASELQASFISQSNKDYMLDKLTHDVARSMRVGPYNDLKSTLDEFRDTDE